VPLLVSAPVLASALESEAMVASFPASTPTVPPVPVSVETVASLPGAVLPSGSVWGGLEEVQPDAASATDKVVAARVIVLGMALLK
jgi:hypothetical protein